MWRSSNPAIENQEAFNPFSYQDDGAGTIGAVAVRPQTASVQGVINKTAIFCGLTIAAGMAGFWALQSLGWNVLMLSSITGLIVTIGVYFFIHRRPQVAPIAGPIYAVAEGFFLGALTAGLEAILQANGIQAMGGIGLQAFVITASVLVAMLALYKTRIIKPSAGLASFLGVATFGIMIAYALTWILSMFGASMPLLRLTDAFGGGTIPLIALGLNVFILGIASLWLIIDFGMIEEQISSGAPKQVEWYCAFCLMVTLAWIYYEAVKLAFRLAILLNSRD